MSKILNFLTIGEVWDPSLAFVMLSGVTINTITFNYILRRVPKPILLGDNGSYSVPGRGVIDARLMVGSAIFGLGWGIGGLCPGPGVIVFFSMTEAILWVIAMSIGQITFDQAL